ncbi:Tapasin [Liparis tanakae]|uniref:Tapasin n=1 Tax=Liparis tanakae TaxID=230148 RepID=A0A4Z2EY09_9TELE|nr:Tapasin [Liparis tanakae]
MSLLLRISVYLCLCAGVPRVTLLSWLPCQFTDEHVFLNPANLTETELRPREAALQFGQAGDAPLNPHAVTFLIAGSKLDLRRFLEETEAEHLDCELRRFSTDGRHARWPVTGATGYNRWFSCTLRHAQGLFTVTGVLRQPTDQPAPGQHDYHSWPAIADGETLTTSVAVVIKTRTPSVRAALASQQKLHCQFAVDHRGPNVTVEWHRQRRGERTRLFSHGARSGRSEGAGVGPRGLAGGDASYGLPFARITSGGTYVCSVAIPPLFVSLDISLHIEEPPRVSLNVGPALSLQEGGERKVSCEAEGYYPLDVEMVWSVQDPAALDGRGGGAPPPQLLQNVLLSSHKRNHDDTYSLTAFFLLRAAPRDSGRRFTCSASHRSLRAPVRKSFVLTVEGERSSLQCRRPPHGGGRAPPDRRVLFRPQSPAAGPAPWASPPSGCSRCCSRCCCCSRCTQRENTCR